MIKKISNKKIKFLIVIVSVLLVIVGIYFIISTNAKINKQKAYINNNNSNIEIIVEQNNNGMQESISNVQDSATNPNFGAATVQEIGGGENPAGQQNMDEILKNKEIKINK